MSEFEAGPVQQVQHAEGFSYGVVIVRLPHRQPVFTVSMPTAEKAEEARRMLNKMIEDGAEFVKAP